MRSWCLLLLPILLLLLLPLIPSSSPPASPHSPSPLSSPLPLLLLLLHPLLLHLLLFHLLLLLLLLLFILIFLLILLLLLLLLFQTTSLMYFSQSSVFLVLLSLSYVLHSTEVQTSVQDPAQTVVIDCCMLNSHCDVDEDSVWMCTYISIIFLRSCFSHYNCLPPLYVKQTAVCILSSLQLTWYLQNMRAFPPLLWAVLGSSSRRYSLNSLTMWFWCWGS